MLEKLYAKLDEKERQLLAELGPPVLLAASKLSVLDDLWGLSNSDNAVRYVWCPDEKEKMIFATFWLDDNTVSFIKPGDFDKLILL